MKLLILILRHPLRFIDFLSDSKKYLKEHKRSDEENKIFLPKQKIKTTYPEATTKNFNEWSNYIHKLRN